MKKSIYNCPLVTLWMLLVVSVGTLSAQGGDNEISKTISEKYQVTADEMLEISNKYGDVRVNTWDKNEITVDITIRAWGRSERDARELLDLIRIEKDRFSNRIYFKTEVASGNINISKRSGFEIDYTVNMPPKNPLDLENKYGAVYLDDFLGALELNVGYGKLKAERILGKRSMVEIKYGSAEIEEFDDGRLVSKYSKPMRIEKVGDLDLDDKYGGVEIGEANSITATSGYSSLSIGTLHHSLLLESKYGSADIRKVAAGFDEIDVETSYGSFTGDFENGADFDFDVTTKYGSFDYSLDLTIRRQIEKSYTSKEYSGFHGQQGKGRVKASASYGKVKFR